MKAEYEKVTLRACCPNDCKEMRFNVQILCKSGTPTDKIDKPVLTTDCPGCGQHVELIMFISH